jgi:hypothetical protein
MQQTLNVDDLIPVINELSDDIPLNVYRQLVVNIAKLMNKKTDGDHFAVCCGIVIKNN